MRSVPSESDCSESRAHQVFYNLCTNATTALELFLNFDCDVDEKSLAVREIAQVVVCFS